MVKQFDEIKKIVLQYVENFKKKHFVLKKSFYTVPMLKEGQMKIVT